MKAAPSPSSSADRIDGTIRSRRRLLYSYRLGGLDWSPFQEDRTFSFADLPAGKHDLQVRAMDRNCNIDPNPAHLDFVDRPALVQGIAAGD